MSPAALATAVADAGGVGSITALGMTGAALDKILARMTAWTAGVLAANCPGAAVVAGAVVAGAVVAGAAADGNYGRLIGCM